MDDDFGDDDLDSIPDTLLQLEHSASQRPKPKLNASSPKQAQQPQRIQQGRIQTYSSHGITRNDSSGKGTWRPPQPRSQPRPAPVQSAPPPSAPEPPSSDYGFDDEDVIDLDEPVAGTQPPSNVALRGRRESSAGQTSQQEDQHRAPSATQAAYAAADADLGTYRPGQWISAPHLQSKSKSNVPSDVSTLQARVAELEAAQEKLRQLEQHARNAVLAKQGEIAIVRTNQAKASKEYERRIAVMQKLHADEAAKQRVELEAGRKQREKMETDNRFLQHDLAQEAGRANRPTGVNKATRTVSAGTGRETPTKNRKGGVGDGFADSEVRMLSPSKGKEKEKVNEPTPKLGSKRKRQTQDSPTTGLSFAQSQPAPVASISIEAGLTGPSSIQVPIAKTVEDGGYQFMQRLLGHRPYEGHERSVETLTKHHFPSNPRQSLLSMLMDALTGPEPGQGNEMNLKLSRVALGLWSTCLREKYYQPIYLLLDLIRFALHLELSPAISSFIEEAVPLCVQTIDLIAVHLARAAVKPSYADDPEYKAMEKRASHIDVDEILDLLHLLSQSASLSPERIQTFWQRLEFTFVLLMLNKAHPITQVTTTLNILATSTLQETFGPIVADAQVQAKQERDLIDRLTTILVFEDPLPPPDGLPYTPSELLALRVQLLHLFRALARTPHGGLVLAQHRSAIGRLVRFLEAQVRRLYTTRPSLGLEKLSLTATLPREHGQEKAHHPHDLVITTVNLTTRLLHHLLIPSTSNATLNFSDKISAVKGGYQKFLVALTRIAFSDGLVLERGLDEEVVEAAHGILDGVLSPEEGEAVVRAVETPRGTKGWSVTERDTGERILSAGEVGNGDDEAEEDG